ncbi:MAG: hypothetical protein HYS76_01345 [Candidatus Wildermuthbacteria bacterium]|nr:hypothetical protein [Candidatus Wildermuthbacteria bacterium]
MKKLFLALAALGVFVAGVALAANANDIVFPVQELGGCKNEQACKTYCDKPDNMAPCVAFAKAHNLMSQQEIKRAEALLSSLDAGGPGGCTSKESCETFCNDVTNIEACIGFAEKHGLMDENELKESKQVIRALKKGAKLPGGCTSKESCETYCQDPNNVEECVSFAEAAGFIKPEEAAEARKMMGFMQRGETPGNCKGRESCDAYCSHDANVMECVAFAEKAGMISKEDADMARKTGGRGPGGCRSKESCDAFCNAPDNQQACFEFAKEHGLIPEEKLAEMKEGMARLRAGVKQAPEEVVACLKANLGETIIQEIEAGTFTPGPATGEKIKGCFESMMSKVKEEMKKHFEGMPEKVRACLEENLGKDVVEQIAQGQAPPSPEMGDFMRACFELTRPSPAEMQEQIMQNMPQEMRACAQPKLAEYLQSLQKQEQPEMENRIRGIVDACAQDFQAREIEKQTQQIQRSEAENIPSPEGMNQEQQAEFERIKQERILQETERRIQEEVRRQTQEAQQLPTAP